MIIVTGATGTVGSSLVRRLSESGKRVRALTRDASRAPLLPGVEWVQGDLGAEAALPEIFKGALSLFLLTSNTPDMAGLQLNALRAAHAAGVPRIVKQSALGASDHSKSPIGRAHHEVERALQASGRGWTILRPHAFMQNFLAMAPGIRAQREVRSASGEGKIPFVDARDIADVAAVALTTPGHEGRKYVLTGPDALSYLDIASLIQEVTGAPTRFIAESEAEARARMANAGASPWDIESAMALAGYQRAGGPTAGLSPHVLEVLGRPPRSMRQFIGENAAAFGGR